MAITFFKQAIEIDPDYAKAFAGIADCYTWMGIYNLYPPEETFKKAKRWAQRALEMDDTIAEAHSSLAFTSLCYDWDWAEAGRGFQRAIELNRNCATAHQGYAHLLVALGRFDEALDEIERALRIDPSSLIINVVKGVILYEARRYDSSLEQFLKTTELDNRFDAAYYGLALVYGKKGQFHEASTSARKAYRLSLYEPIKKTVMAYVHAMFDEVDKATQELSELNESRRTRDAYVSPFHMALIYVALNKLDQAFECLEEAFKDRDQWLVFLKVEPRLDTLRSYPQFQDLLLRLNFD
jgi:tetratricopeptide (TPR) repeat protein